MPCQTLSHSHDIAPALSSGNCVPVVSLKITAKYAIKMFSINKEWWETKSLPVGYDISQDKE